MCFYPFPRSRVEFLCNSVAGKLNCRWEIVDMTAAAQLKDHRREITGDSRARANMRRVTSASESVCGVADV